MSCAKPSRRCRGARCKCGSALAHAIITDREKIPAATEEKLKPILG